MGYIASVIADVHTSSTDSAWKDSAVKGDARWAIEQFVNLSIEKRVLVAIALGDLLNKSSNKARAVEPWVKAVDRLREHGIEFLFVQGNHDYDDPPWLSAVCPHATHAHGKLSTIGGFQFYGLDYQPANRLTDELSSVPVGTDFLLCHQSWQEFMGFDGSYQGSLADVRNAKVVLTGDYHKSTALKLDNGTVVHSLGATSMQSIAEPTEHYCGLISTSGKFFKHKLTSRRVIESPNLGFFEEASAYLTSLPKLVAAARKEAKEFGMPEELLKPIVIINYGSVQGMKARVEAMVGNLAHLFFRRTVSQGSAVVETLAVDHGKTSLRQEVEAELGDTKQDVLLRQLLLGMLDAADPVEFEKRFREKFLEA